jgi:hypothetical protein
MAIPRTFRVNVPIATDEARVNGIPVPEHRNLGIRGQIRG